MASSDSYPNSLYAKYIISICVSCVPFGVTVADANARVPVARVSWAGNWTPEHSPTLLVLPHICPPPQQLVVGPMMAIGLERPTAGIRSDVIQNSAGEFPRTPLTLRSGE